MIRFNFGVRLGLIWFGVVFMVTVYSVRFRFMARVTFYIGLRWIRCGVKFKCRE